jgi:hypothetical protein
MREIRDLDPDQITPLEALEKIHRWKSLLEKADHFKEESGSGEIKNSGGKTKAAAVSPADPTPSLFD